MNLGLVMTGLMLFAASPPEPAGATAPETSSAVAVPASQPTKVKIDEALIRRLLGSESTSPDAVERMLERMEQSSRRLTDSLDPGPQTQAQQADALAALDALIVEAERRLLKSRQASNTVRRRTSSPDARRRNRSGEGRAEGGPKPARRADGDRAGSEGKTAGANDGSVEPGRGWGYLPQRDRDEIRQGLDEEFLPRFREAIRRYYRDLARKAAEQ